MRKVDDQEKIEKEKEKEKRKEKIMSCLVATNVVASRLPERRPTGTPYAQHLTLFGVRCLCGVPWMDAML